MRLSARIVVLHRHAAGLVLRRYALDVGSFIANLTVPVLRFTPGMVVAAFRPEYIYRPAFYTVHPQDAGSALVCS